MKEKELLELIISKIKTKKDLNFVEIQETISCNIDFSEISSLVNSINAPNAQKRKYYNSIILSKIVVKTVDWFNSNEGVEWKKSQGTKWSNEIIGKKIFGWQKSFFYKLLKMGKLQDQIFLAFDNHCDNYPKDNLNRTIENLLKFSKAYNFGNNQNKSILEKELTKLRRIVLHQKKIFISLESINLSMK